MTKIPVRLENDSIISCVVEMRFIAVSDNVANVMPGILYSKFDGRYTKTDSTPESQIPREFRDKDPKLKYRSLVNLRGAKETVGIGESNITITFLHPYPGWQEVEEQAVAILQAAIDTGLIKQVERISVLYQNIVDILDDPHDLSLLDMELRIGSGMSFRGPGTMIRREVEREGTISIIQISTGATGNIIDADGAVLNEKTGVSIIIDTIKFGHVSNYDELIDSLRLVHGHEKETFFSLLKAETVVKMNPIWE